MAIVPHHRFSVAWTIAISPKVLNLIFFRSVMKCMRRRRTQLALFSAISFMCLVATGVLTFQVFSKLEDYGSAKRGNITWILTQIEVDHVKLLSALEKLAAPTPDRLRDARRRFDALYNRINNVQGSQPYQTVLRGTDADLRLTSLHTGLQALTPVFDADDQKLAAQQDRMLQAVNALAPGIRAISMEGITIDAASRDAEREALTQKLIQLTLLSLLLVTTLVSLMVMLWRLFILYRFRAIENQSILQRLKTILNTSEDAVVVFQNDGQIVDANTTARHLFGWPPQFSMSARRAPNIAEILFEKDDQDQCAPVSGQTLVQACRAGTKLPTVLTARRHDAQLVPVEVSANLLSQPDYQVFVCFLRDISERLAADSEIRAARDKILQDERAKATFLARISHEMRTPLHGIIGALDLLKATPLRPDQARFADVMKSSAQILLGQIEDAIGVSRSGGPQIELSPVPFNLDQLLKDLIFSQKPKARARNTDLRLTQGSLGFDSVYGDPERVQQILLNLISNAVKYTENGQVTLEACRLPDDGKTDDVVEFQISDTGIGIAQEDMSRIFDDYVRLSPTGHDPVEGSGLGLGIVRNLVTLMGGQIGAESLEGQGSVFWVRVPLPKVPNVECDIIETASPAKKHAWSQTILVVEDNAINRFVLERMLVSDGHTVTLANCGRDGVAMATAQPYDLIIMDVHMPDIDGIEATRRIRKAIGQGDQPRIVALTAFFSDTDRAAMAAAGIDDIWTKPLKLEDLHALLHDSGRQSETPHIPNDTAAADRPDIVTDALADLRNSVPIHRLTAFVDEFANEAQTILESVPAQSTVVDAELAGKLHKLAGSAAVLGAARAHSLLAQAEESARLQDHVALYRALRDLADVLPVTLTSMTARLIHSDPAPK